MMTHPVYTEKTYTEYQVRSAVALAYVTASEEVASGRYNLVGLNSYFLALATRVLSGSDPLEIYQEWQKRLQTPANEGTSE